ncbi:hypothetical protein [Microvirga flavescens]|uniref:hypothetical protein n=1 Tax=Microvirga flavescens TaxID=2249811 RepID=UPI001300A871|nr:hypothetical protein [Microvirga flavescens]
MRKMHFAALAAALGAAFILSGTGRVEAQDGSVYQRPYAPHAVRPYRPAARYHYYNGYYYSGVPYYGPGPYDEGVTGAIGSGPEYGFAEPYPGSPELWPPCFEGPPACTAAGYPNLHYYREMGR